MEAPTGTILKRPLYFWCRLLLGTVFLLASIDKIRHPRGFAEIVYNYQILPDLWVNLTAILLPWVELVLGVFLIAGLWAPGAVLLSNLMLLTFFCLMVFNLARGLNVDCGCFSTRPSEDPSVLWQVSRDILFLFLAAYLLFKVNIQGSGRTADDRRQPSEDG